MRALRARRGLTQEEFAVAIGMDVSYSASCERGQRDVGLLALARIAAGFGLTVSRLLKFD